MDLVKEPFIYQIYVYVCVYVCLRKNCLCIKKSTLTSMSSSMLRLRHLDACVKRVLISHRFMTTNSGNNNHQDPFETLGVSRGASVAEIKAAFNRRAKETHPDTAVDKSNAEFVRVRAAFERAVHIAQGGAESSPDAPPFVASDRRARASAYTTSSSASDYVSAAKALSLVAVLSALLSASILWMHWETKQRTGSIAVVHYRRPDK